MKFDAGLNDLKKKFDYKIIKNKAKMMLTTVKDYCTRRGVSRQFVYQYIKKGKFELIELPIYTDYEGIKVSVGIQKFLKVPPQYNVEKRAYWSGDVTDLEYAHALAIDSTSDKELQKHIAHFINLDAVDADGYKTYLLTTAYPINHPKRPLLDAAFENCKQLMLAEMSDIEQNLERLETSLRE